MATADSRDDESLSNKERLLAVEYDLETLIATLDEDPEMAYDEQVLMALGLSKNAGADNQLWARFKPRMTEYDTIDYNEYQKLIKETAEDLKSEAVVDGGTEDGPLPISKPDEPVYWEAVEECVLRNFGQKMLDSVEALCANAMVLVFKEIDNAPMIFLEGASGAGKTTSIKFIEGTMGELLVRIDEVTAPSFVSHSTDQGDDERGKDDILPVVKHRLMSVREMSKLFSGDPDKIKDFWATLAGVGDGDGYNKATGSQGLRGHVGDFMFAFQGATTPLSPVAWNAMGTIGGRVLFHEMLGNPAQHEIKEGQWGYEKGHSARIDECREIVSDFLRTVWHEMADGYGSVDWRDTEWREDHDDWRPDDDVQNAITIFAELIAKARTPAGRDGDEWRIGTPEVPHRLVDQISNLCRAKAFMQGKEVVEIEDVELAARISLSTMPEARRPYVRWIMDHREEDFVLADGLVEYTGDSRNTVVKHMKLMDHLGLGDFADVGEPNSPKYKLEKNYTYSNVWETGVPFPERYFDRDDE